MVSSKEGGYGGPRPKWFFLYCFTEEAWNQVYQRVWPPQDLGYKTPAPFCQGWLKANSTGEEALDGMSWPPHSQGLTTSPGYAKL